MQGQGPPTEESRLPEEPGPRPLSAQNEALKSQTLQTQAAVTHRSLEQEVI